MPVSSLDDFEMVYEAAKSSRLRTPLVTAHIEFPEQVLVLAGSGDRGNDENIFLRKIVLGL